MVAAMGALVPSLWAPAQRGLTSRPAPQQHARAAGAAAARWQRRRCAAAATRAAGAAATGEAPTQELTLEDLKAGLEEAVKAEDYASAARIRDRIREHPITQTEAELDAAVKAERFDEAARLRDRLKELRPPPPPPPPPPAPASDFTYDPTSTTTSECTTDGVRVTCRSFFVPHQSRPASGSYFFAYDIKIVNESQHTIKVMERYWKIHNGLGQMQEVRGAGVVGEQPELAPGESFSYQSACPLPTPRGTMEGHYEVYARDETSGQWRRSFLVKIDQFALRADDLA